MGIASWIIIGLIVGFVAGFILKSRGARMLSIVAVSVLGAVLGGVDVAYLFGVPGAASGFNLFGLLVAVAGALFAITLLRLLTRPKNQVVE